MKSPLGKNEIGKFLSKAAEKAGIKQGGVKISNHSVRKTHVGRLLDANTPEIFVAQSSGHKRVESLQSYKSASEKHQRQMSHILSRSQPSTNGPLALNQFGSHSSSLQIAETTRGETMTSTSNLQSLAISSESTSRQVNPSAIFAGASIGSFSNCTFQVIQGPVEIIQNGHKRRRAVIESDEED